MNVTSAVQGAPTTAEDTVVLKRNCPTCEAACGLLVEVDQAENRILSVHGDPDDHRSKGYVCAKSQAFRYIYEDDQRLRCPVKRTEDGWEEISWDDAYTLVREKISGIRDEYGKDAIAMYIGNPIGHIYAAQLYLRSLMEMLQTERFFSAGTVDQHPQQMGSFTLYGQEWLFPIPDIERTDLLICMGGNPLVSQGSLMSAPDVKARFEALQARGGKLVVIDPRYTETAEVADQHIYIKPGTDAYMLMSWVNEIFANDWVTLGHLDGLVDGIEWIRDVAAEYPAEKTAAVTGVDADVLQALVRDYCNTEKAAAYGRIGLCTQQFGTLASWLVDVISILTGHLDVRGGMMFPRAPHSAPGQPKIDTSEHWGRWKSRVSGFPETCGELPASLMAEELEAGGEDQVKALVTICGNPVLSVPNGKRIREAIKGLDFYVALDIYINETTSQADLILPSTTHAEEGNYDLLSAGISGRNFAAYADGQLEPDPRLRPLWEMVCEIAAGLGGMTGEQLDGFMFENVAESAVKQAAEVGRELDKETIVAAAKYDRGPQRLLDIMLRNGPYGDGFDDDADGLSLAKLAETGESIDLGPLQPQLPDQLSTEGRRIRLQHALYDDDFPRLSQVFAEKLAEADGDENELMLIGRRHIRDMNSWLHNLTPYIRGKNRCTMLISETDASRIGVVDGGEARVVSRVGEATVPVEVTDAIMPGVVSIPHGFGHLYDDTEQSEAMGRMPGISCNDLIDDTVLDVASGTSVVNGARVKVFPAA